jgi:flagellum-specific ATP synthase
MKAYGKVVEITGIIIKATGIPASIGESCRIFPDNTCSVDAEVVGFRDGKILLMAVGDLTGIKLGSRVLPVSKRSHKSFSSVKGR